MDRKNVALEIAMNSIEAINLSQRPKHGGYSQIGEWGKPLAGIFQAALGVLEGTDLKASDDDERVALKLSCSFTKYIPHTTNIPEFEQMAELARATTSLYLATLKLLTKKP